MKKTLNEKGISVEQGRMIVCDRNYWSSDECMGNDSASITCRGGSHESSVI